MTSTVKICGLATAATLEAALDAGADMVGLVFFAKSPRFVGLDHAHELAAQARDRAKIVALTVDAEDDLLAAIVRVVGPDMLQLHGRETPQRVAAIKQAFGLPAMKAIGVAEAADFARARDYEGVADWLLIDAKPPKDAVLPGGNGRPFDWRLARGFAPKIPWLLSGGLDAGQRRRGDRAVGRARRRRLLRRRARAGRQGREQESRPSPPPRAPPSRANTRQGAPRDQSRQAQFVPQRPRRARPFRHFRRPLRRRDADAAGAGAGAGLRARPRTTPNSTANSTAC